MKPFQISIVLVLIFVLLVSACSQSTPEALPTIENSPANTPLPTGTFTPEPPTATPIPPTPTQEPSPTPIDLLTLVDDFEIFLNASEQSADSVTLSGDNKITNQSPAVIQVADISNLLAYYEEVEAGISLAECEQTGDLLSCAASETKQLVEDANDNLDLEPLTYDEFTFSTDAEGNVREISLLLSIDSVQMLETWIKFNKSWLGDTEISQAIFSPNDQLIYSRESGRQINLLPETVNRNIEETVELLLEAEEKYQAGDYEAAISVYEEMLSMPTPADLRYSNLVLIADANDDLGNYEEAIEHYLLAVEIDGSDPKILNNLCWDYGLIEQAQETLPYCEEAIKLEPTSNHMDSRGLAYGLLGDYEAAIVDFEAVISDLENSTNPELSAIAAQRVEWVALMEAGENPFTAEEMAILRGEVESEAAEPPSEGGSGESVQTASGGSDAASLGEQYLSEGNFEAAISAYTEAIAMEPQNPSYYQARSDAYFLTSQFDKMMADLNQSIALGSQDGFVYYSRGFFSWMNGNSPQAISDLETGLALGLPPDVQSQAEELLAHLKQ